MSSIDVREITRELIEIIKKSDGRIARHLHIPLQSGSDRILKAMKRNYNTGYFIDKVSMVGDLIPEATITTDVIVGFPGETDDDFYLTLDLFDKLKFSKVHVFKYSRRAGTAAAGMQAQVSENIKTIRSLAARKKGEAIREEFLAKNTGKVLEVVCEEFDSTGMTKGLADGISENYIRVYFEMDREEFSSEKGRIIRVKAVQQYMDGLKGFAQML